MAIIINFNQIYYLCQNNNIYEIYQKKKKQICLHRKYKSQHSPITQSSNNVDKNILQQNIFHGKCSHTTHINCIYDCIWKNILFIMQQLEISLYLTYLNYSWSSVHFLQFCYIFFTFTLCSSQFHILMFFLHFFFLVRWKLWRLSLLNWQFN